MTFTSEENELNGEYVTKQPFTLIIRVTGETTPQTITINDANWIFTKDTTNSHLYSFTNKYTVETVPICKVGTLVRMNDFSYTGSDVGALPNIIGVVNGVIKIKKCYHHHKTFYKLIYTGTNNYASISYSAILVRKHEQKEDTDFTLATEMPDL